jgi:hypothetical protein
MKHYVTMIPVEDLYADCKAQIQGYPPDSAQHRRIAEQMAELEKKYPELKEKSNG